MAAGGEDAVVLVDLGAAMALRQVLHHAADHHHVEGAGGVREPAGLGIAEEAHLAHLLEAQLLELDPRHRREGRVRVEGRDVGDLGLLVQVLRHVAEGAADLEDGEVAGARGPEVPEERAQEVAAARVLERQVEGGAARPLALDEHPQHALAVGGLVCPPIHREHAPIAPVDERVRRDRLAHAAEYSNGARQPGPPALAQTAKSLLERRRPSRERLSVPSRRQWPSPGSAVPSSATD